MYSIHVVEISEGEDRRMEKFKSTFDNNFSKLMKHAKAHDQGPQRIPINTNYNVNIKHTCLYICVCLHYI